MRQNLPAGMVTLDAEKAFNKVLWPYMFETLKNFGLHTTFINWLKAMYKQPNAKVRVTGVLFNTFKISKGTRQGDPLSPLIFVLCIEPLAEYIRLERKMKG